MMNIAMAFSSNDAAKLSNLSQSTLRYWEKTGVFTPSFIGNRPHRPFRRIYSFRDLVSLRTLATLRKVHNIPLDELRQAGQYLKQYADHPWASLKLGVTGGDLAVYHPDHERWVSAHPLGQLILIDVDEIVRTTERAARSLLHRNPETFGRVERNRYVLGNAWVISGTRIPTSTIKHLHDTGLGTDEITRKYPRLTPQDIEAAIAHEETLQAQVA